MDQDFPVSTSSAEAVLFLKTTALFISAWQSHSFVKQHSPVEARIQPLRRGTGVSAEPLPAQPLPLPGSARFSQGDTVGLCGWNTASGLGLAGITGQCLHKRSGAM